MFFAILPPEKNSSVPHSPNESGSHQPARKSSFLFDRFASSLEGETNNKSLYKRDVSVQSQVQEALAHAEKIAENLSELKERLIFEFGETSHSFIARSLDPMIDHARKLIHDLKSHTDEKNAPLILEKAVDSVELYAQFSDERRLKKKIVHEAVLATKQLIQKDCEILRNYEAQILQNEVLLTPERDELELKLGEKLAPVFHEFEQLASEDFHTEDLRELFLWKSKIDAQRGALTELGFYTVDSLLGRKQMSFSSSDVSLANERGILSNEQVAKMEEIEEKALSLLQILEERQFYDASVFQEIDELITGLKGDVQRVEPSVTEEFQDVFGSVQEIIQQLEQVLENKRKSLE